MASKKASKKAAGKAVKKAPKKAAPKRKALAMAAEAAPDEILVGGSGGNG